MQGFSFVTFDFRAKVFGFGGRIWKRLSHLQPGGKKVGKKRFRGRSKLYGVNLERCGLRGLTTLKRGCEC